MTHNVRRNLAKNLIIKSSFWNLDAFLKGCGERANDREHWNKSCWHVGRRDNVKKVFWTRHLFAQAFILRLNTYKAEIMPVAGFSVMCHLEKRQKGQSSAARVVSDFFLKARKRKSCFTPPQNISLAAYPIIYCVRYQLFGAPVSLIAPLFIFLVFFVCTLHQDNSAPLLTREHNAFRTLRPKHLDIALFPRLLLLSGIPCLEK